MKRHVAVLAAVFGLIQMPVHAMEWYFDIAYADGGETLADVTLVDSNGDYSSDEVTAGGGPSLSFGIHQAIGESFALQAAYGYKEEAVRADNGSSSFKRMTLDLLAFWEPGDWRIGAGFTKEMSPELKAGDDFFRTDFADATGSIFEIDYRMTESFSLGVRRTMLDYDVTLSAPGYYPVNMTVDGDNWSLRAVFIF